MPAGAPPATLTTEPLPADVSAHLARMTPLFDGKTLDGWIQMPPAALTISASEVRDLGAFAKRLAGRGDPVAAFVYGQIGDSARHVADSLATLTGVTRAPGVFLRNVNALVNGPSIYEPTRFAGVTLRDETKELRQSAPTGWRLARLNRMLLEDAFSQDLPRSPSTAWVVKDGAMASTGSGRGVIYTKDDYTHYRLVFQVRQISGNHVPGILLFGARTPEGERGLDAIGAIQFQVPNGGHWDYRPGKNTGGTHFTRPLRPRFDIKEWSQVEVLVDARTGKAQMAVAQPIGTKGIVNLLFDDPAAGRAGPIAWQMHNAGLFDEFRDVKIEISPRENRLLTAQ